MHYLTPILVWLGQILLLLATLAATQLTSGSFQYSLNFAIATVIAALTLAIFMRLKPADGVIRLVALSGLLWIGFLLLLTILDLVTR